MVNVSPLAISKLMFQMPEAFAGITPELKFESGRDHTLVCRNDDEFYGSAVQLSLIFRRVWAMRVVYFVAGDLRLFVTAYEKVVDLGQTKWLRNLQQNIVESGEDHGGLSHYAICFDDGPSYEFICEGFDTVSYLNDDK